jgi:hypothetical protein
LVIKSIGQRFSSIGREHHVIENISKIYEIALSEDELTFVCDSSHRSTQAKLLWLQYRDKFRIIHLVRDGRGVTNSVMKRKGISMKQSARAWKRNNLYTLVTQLGIPKNNLIRVRYEDICANPERQIRRIVDFAGIDLKGVNTHLAGYGFHYVGGSSTLRGPGGNIHDIRVDEKWKVELSPREKVVFDRIAGRINRLYGYA